MYFRHKGFTLVELLITVVVVSIGVALAVPSWDNLVQKRQVTSAAEELASFLAYAQSEAVKSNEEVTVTFKRNGAGTAWCIGAIDEETKDANGLDHCECDAAINHASQCKIAGQIARVYNGGFEKFTMDSSQQEGTDSTDMHFNFDPIRGIKTADDGITVDSNEHLVTVVSANGHFKLQVDVEVTGRVRVCNPVSTKQIPGFQSCSSGPIIVNPPPVISP
ncbi:MAG: GspH/FimT family pseudopilin [Gammaproteobacteria bacterium]|nr:GspH/FimT family pseudopilin [Gammaproteobacteria bacterium]NNE04576.1 prepilin-type N-terminal cleavage/methylation domain-containing protein [Xanthomonadales bacterium]